MPIATSSQGRRKGPSSPSSSTHPSPCLPSASLPRLKLSVRNTPPPSSSRSQSTSRPRSYHSNQRRSTYDSDSDSELTPQDDDDDEDEDMEEDRYTPRMMKQSSVHHSLTKGKAAETPQKGKIATASAKKGRPSSVSTKKTQGKKAAEPAIQKDVGTSGPGGRDRKRAVKVGDKERKRARDEKFGVNSGDGFAMTTPTRIGRSPPTYADSDTASSFGDDESEHDASFAPPAAAISAAPPLFNMQDVTMGELPETFAGQEIEDLNYGGGVPEFEMEREVLTGWWQNSSDEEEEVYVNHLSGSEAEHGSQSSVHESDSAISSDTDYSSTSDEEIDEFGFPLPSTAAPGVPMEEGPLVLMENWDGQFVLVQPRQDRSRSRRRGSRGSRTNGSVGGSTVLSSAEQQLLIDADADAPCSSSEWSGVSDEDDGGDTTDSMAEEDMPMLDSPALDQLIGEQLGINAFTGIMEGQQLPTPSIVVTEAIPELTPALSTPSFNTPQPPTGFPQTPMAPPPVPFASSSQSPIAPPPVQLPPGPMIPIMGTFHPTTDDPAQHAVIDGSKIPTKSPFTHRRRSRRGRAGSVSTTGQSTQAEAIGERERKRKTSNGLITPGQIGPMDPFFPSTLPKRARYSSIPGHPRFVAARRAAMLSEAGDETTDDEVDGEVEGLDLDDMLESELLTHGTVGDAMGPVGGERFRFDRVPVSAYLRRNFGGNAPRIAEDEMMAMSTFSSPITNRSYGYGMGMGMGMSSFGGIAETFGTLGDTLAGPAPRMMLVSPAFGAVPDQPMENGALSRKEKRRRKRMGGQEEVPALQI